MLLMHVQKDSHFLLQRILYQCINKVVEGYVVPGVANIICALYLLLEFCFVSETFNVGYLDHCYTVLL